LGVISEPAPDVVIEQVQDWTRGGDETYIYRFRVVLPGRVEDLLLKAIVAFSLTKPLTEIADEWVARRRLLATEGIATPTLYCAKRALLMERFIPYNLSDFLRGTPVPPSRLVGQVIRYAAVLDKLGFCALAPFHGLRTDGTDMFAIDFGQDLGPPALGPRRDGRMLAEAMRWLESCGQSIDKDRAIGLYARRLSETKSEADGWI
jgi:hypothetical protein